MGKLTIIKRRKKKLEGNRLQITIAPYEEQGCKTGLRRVHMEKDWKAREDFAGVVVAVRSSLQRKLCVCLVKDEGKAD